EHMLPTQAKLHLAREAEPRIEDGVAPGFMLVRKESRSQPAGSIELRLAARPAARLDADIGIDCPPGLLIARYRNAEIGRAVLEVAEPESRPDAGEQADAGTPVGLDHEIIFAAQADIPRLGVQGGARAVVELDAADVAHLS